MTVPSSLGRVGAYELLLELASGGMATVYLARPVDGRAGGGLVAVKRPHRHLIGEKVFVSMLLDEARLASTIDHVAVVKVRELGFESTEPFLVLDYVDGGSLSELRKELAAAERALDPKVAVRVAVDALSGLHAAHTLKDENNKPLGIIHRDISPHNILVGFDGLARLTDFGIAKAEDRVQVTRTNEVKGKIAYFAPERVDSRRMCTRQSDVFSMAVVLWECLAGRRLFRGDEALDTLDQVLHAPIPKLRQLGLEIPPALDAAIARALSRHVEERFLTADEFAQAIVKGAGPGGVGTHADVARVVDVVLGPRARTLHDRLRQALGREEAERVLTHSGIAPRKPIGEGESTSVLGSLLVAISSPAPSARYAFGALESAPEPSQPPITKTPIRWKPLTLIVGSALLGAVAMDLVSRRGRLTPPRVADTAASAVATGPLAGGSEDSSSLREAGTPPDASPPLDASVPMPLPSSRRPIGLSPKAPAIVRDGFTKLR